MLKFLKPKQRTSVNSQEFYELMYSYRHSPMANQEEVVKNFEEVKKWIRKNYRRRLFKNKTK
jgi:hypothetical protein